MLLDFDILKVVSNDIKPEAGKVLISEPLLDDLYFKRSVVLLCESYNDSFLGLILNLKSDLFLHDVLDGFTKTNISLYLGGPVDPDVLYFIHSFNYIKNSYKIADGIFLNGDLEDVKQLVNSGIATDKNIKFFLGNSGWAPGQLREEIAYNSWLVGEMPYKHMFPGDSNLWLKSLDFVDSKYQVWKNFPTDPEYN